MASPEYNFSGALTTWKGAVMSYYMLSQVAHLPISRRHKSCGASEDLGRARHRGRTESEGERVRKEVFGGQNQRCAILSLNRSL